MRWIMCAVSALAAVGGATLSARAEPDHAEEQCVAPYVWRQATNEDRVCVTLEARIAAQNENNAGPDRREPNGGAYGPNTCRMGYVWRSAFPGDVVCVPPEARDRVARENADGPSHRQFASNSLTTGGISGTSAPPRFRIPQGPGTSGPITYGSQPQYARDRVQPGIYQLKSVSAGLCATVIFRDNGTSYLGLGDCRVNANGGAINSFAIVRETDQTQTDFFFTIRPVRPGANGPAVGRNCAGIAPGVVVGPASIDVNQCAEDIAPRGIAECGRMNFEQSFKMVSDGRPERQIYRLLSYEGSRRDCVTVRDGGRDPGTEFISWPCKDLVEDPTINEQLFQVISVGPSPAPLNACPRIQ